MDEVRFSMKNVVNLVAVTFCMAYACSSTYKFTEMYSSEHLKKTNINNLMLMVLYPEDMIETRVALETSMADEFKKNSIQAYCGYMSLGSYNNLADRTEEIKSALREANTDNLLIIDPIRAIEHDPSAYHNEVAFYRAFRMESAEFWSSVTEIIESADASNFIYGVSIWNMQAGEFIWQGTYDIHAPGGYELQNAKAYAREFSKVILDTLKEKN